MRTLQPSYPGAEARVKGVDFYGRISSGTSHSLTTLVINPRSTTTFTRLSSEAAVWRRYRINALKVHIFGLAAANQSGYGAIASLVTDDLGSNYQPTTEDQILNLEGVRVVKPWSYGSHTVKVNAAGLKWYSTDILYSTPDFGENMGYIYLSMPGTTTAGSIVFQVYIEYDVEFCERIPQDLVVSTGIGGAINGTGCTPTNVLGTAVGIDPQAKGIDVDVAAGQVVFKNPGYFIINFRILGTALASLSWSTTATLATKFATVGTSVMQYTLIGYCNIGDTFGPLTLDPASDPDVIDILIGTAALNSLTAVKRRDVQTIACETSVNVDRINSLISRRRELAREISSFVEDAKKLVPIDDSKLTLKPES